MALVKILTLRAVAARSGRSRPTVALDRVAGRLTPAVVVDASGVEQPAVLDDGKLKRYLRARTKAAA